MPLAGAADKVSFDRKISMAQFYAYRIMQRRHAAGSSIELPHAVGRLFQQYIVDSYAKVESMRLDWIQNNQNALRLESLQGLLDHISTGNNLDLPPSSTSSLSLASAFSCFFSSSATSSSPVTS